MLECPYCQSDTQPILMILILVIVIATVYADSCIFQSTGAVHWTDFNLTTSIAGCQREGCSLTWPLAVFEDTPSPYTPTCVSGMVSKCGDGRAIALSMKMTMRLPLFRTLGAAGLQSPLGWWTGSTTSWDYLEGGYVTQDQIHIMGGRVDLTQERGWLCVCNEL